ncbi:glycosyltransferase [Streptomyces sp. ODS28]|uniref:glycosyltransferase n=1 Tax=Streptomyces sp. ODS28 TaxID=3136688 RepID=UPI0031E9B68B
MSELETILDIVAFVIVFLGATPLLSALLQFLLVGFHRFRKLYEKALPENAPRGRAWPYLPRTAILIPAWNEAAVLAASVERLVALEYPPDRLRVVVVDDASTDETPQVMARLQERHPGRVLHLRRENGGQGKAHTLNHGLREVLADDWAEAVLIMDADVIYDRDALWRMTRHLARPEVGAVTAYIKEGSGREGTYLNRYIAFEYIAAQAAARRTQNVLGVVACLAGGAQLHSRENLLALGGQIDTTTLAEDTVTTFETQLGGRRVIFDGAATVRAEEPGGIAGLWKQRLRWARGNLQITHRYRSLWFRGRLAGRHHRLGSWTFGVAWFSLLLTPLLMVLCSLSLLFLYFVGHYERAWSAFHLLWVINLVSYLFIVLVSLAIDPETARRCWREALVFPGIVAVLIMVIAAVPRVFEPLLARWGLGLGPESAHPLVVFFYIWLLLCLPLAWLAKVVAGRRRLRWLAPVLVHLTGYGSLLAACSVAAFFLELRGAEMRWDKTEKTGKAGKVTAADGDGEREVR